MIGDALQFGHQSPQPVRSCGNLDAQRGFGRSCKCQRICNRAVAGCPGGELRCPVERCSDEQGLNALVDVTETLFESNNSFAASRETKMARFNRARMNRSNRNLMQILAFRR